ncbi:MAG: hypothetical protein P0111_15920 [Nitrospira sp.]|nr:hypothetical protein [Nitrospira sp.]
MGDLRWVLQEHDLEWLVRNRSTIQALLLELWKEFPEAPSAGSKPGTVLQLLVGATFSLWRAAFLAESPRDWQEHASHAKKFLSIVVKDNAITYSQEREARFWTVGYYLNNAFLRLEMAYRALDHHTALREEVTDFLKRQMVLAEFSTDPRKPWDLAQSVTRELLKEVRQRW